MAGAAGPTSVAGSGFVTGSLASWIVDRISTEDRPAQVTKQDLAELLTEIRELRAEVAELRADGQKPPTRNAT